MPKAKDLTQRLAEEKEWRARSNVKPIAYRSNGDKPGEDTSGFDPFYGGEGENLIPFPRDRITPWWEEETRRNKEGIMQVASAADDKDYLKMILSRYYTPNELFGKTIKELNKMLEMYINVHGGLI